mmetsp:Transcript_12771/g.38603  ORF Transcript_12771/g.38603 Transcript_12771/m.38603 type:complete len:299 (-) Transcript_12771:103-999(-)
MSVVAASSESAAAVDFTSCSERPIQLTAHSQSSRGGRWGSLKARRCVHVVPTPLLRFSTGAHGLSDCDSQRSRSLHSLSLRSTILKTGVPAANSEREAVRAKMVAIVGPSALNCHARRSARRTQKSRGRAGLLSEHEAALLVLHAPVLLGVRRNLLLVVGQLAPRLGRDLLLPLLERAARHLGGLLLGEPGGARLVLSVRGLDRRALLLEVRRELALRAGLDGASLERVPRLCAADQLGPRRVLVLLHRLPGLARGRLLQCLFCCLLLAPSGCRQQRRERRYPGRGEPESAASRRLKQ